MNSNFEIIADGLAEHGYAVIDQFLSQQEVDAILQLPDFTSAQHSFKKAGIGKSQSLQIQEAIRGDYIQWLDKQHAPQAAKIYLNRLEELIQFLNQALFLSLKDFEVHFTVYPIGSFYKRHLDQFKHDGHRRLSVICYLNNGWTEKHGGQLRIFLPDGANDLLPLAGRLVIFRSDKLEHEVLEAKRERLSITGWVLDQLAELKHL
jgi:SM-20-related protein